MKRERPSEQLERELAELRLSPERKAAILAAMKGAKNVSKRKRLVSTILVAAVLTAVLSLSALAASSTLRDTVDELLKRFSDYTQEVDVPSAEDQGIEIRVVSALYDGSTVWVNYEVQDKTGDRLDKDMELHAFIFPEKPNWNSGVIHGGVLMGYDPVRRTASFSQSVVGNGQEGEELKLRFEVDTMLPGVQYFRAPMPAVELKETPLASQVLPTGETVLVPEQTPAKLEGVDELSLSSYGFASDGSLHVQYRVDVEQVNWEDSWLRVTLGSRAFMEASAEGNVTEIMCARLERYVLSGTSTGPVRVPFVQNGVSYCDIRFGVRPEDIEDVYIDQLHGNYTTKERINGDWRITFPLQRLPVQTIPLDSIWEDTPALALHLSALGCTLELEGEAQHLEPVKQPFTVYLKDGSTVTTADSDGGVYYGAYTSLHWSFPQPADLEQVEGVSIDGWYIPLKNGQAQPGYWLTS